MQSLNPYIADFGASVTIQKGDIDATTEKKKFLGTVGYMDVAIYNRGKQSRLNFNIHYTITANLL